MVIVFHHILVTVIIYNVRHGWQERVLRKPLKGHSCQVWFDLANVFGDQNKYLKSSQRQRMPHVLTLPTFLIRDVTRFVTRVAQRVPQVLILPIFLIRDVTRFVIRVTQLVPQVLILLTFLIRDVTRFATRVTTGATGAYSSYFLHSWRHQVCNKIDNWCHMCLPFLLSSFVTSPDL